MKKRLLVSVMAQRPDSGPAQAGASNFVRRQGRPAARPSPSPLIHPRIPQRHPRTSAPVEPAGTASGTFKIGGVGP